MSDPPSVAILAYGKIARDAHGPSWQRVEAAGRARVDVIYEPTAAGCAAAKAAFPRASVVRADARAVFDSQLACDIVDICTPGDLHHELVLAALAAERHVLVEKPLAHSAAQVDEIISAQRGAVVQVCQTFRFGKPVQLFGSALARGQIGRIVRIHVIHHARHILSEAEWVTRSRPDGAIFENAIHFLDLVHFLLDLDSPLEILATRFRQTDHRPVLTGVEFMGRDDVGREVTIDFLQDSLRHSALMSRALISGTGSDAEMRFYPDGFRLLSGVVDPVHDLGADFRRLVGVARRFVPSRVASPHDMLIDSLLTAVSTGSTPICSPQDVRPAVAVAECLAQLWAATTSPR